MHTLTRGGRFKHARTVLNQHGSQSMDEVYSATWISPSMIKDLEDDDKVRSVGYDKIATLAKHYGVSSDFLLGISDIKTPDTTAQAVIEYTGLSEDNVSTLHRIAENALLRDVFETAEDGTMTINGEQPYLDFLNDILSAVYAGKETFIREYILLRYYAERLPNYDPNFSGESLDDALADHGYTSIPISAFIEHKSMRIARAIEKYLVDKYTATDGQVE